MSTQFQNEMGKSVIISINKITQEGKNNNEELVSVPGLFIQIIGSESEGTHKITLQEGFELYQLLNTYFINKENEQNEKELEEDKLFYKEQKKEGKFNDSWFVIISDKKVLVHTENHEEVANFLTNFSGDEQCILRRVNHEHKVNEWQHNLNRIKTKVRIVRNRPL